MAEKATKIVVLGGGYAGVMAAVRVAGKMKRLNTTVTLVNGLDHFVERPRLHERAAGSELNSRPLAAMVAGMKARFVKGWESSSNGMCARRWQRRWRNRARSAPSFYCTTSSPTNIARSPRSWRRV